MKFRSLVCVLCLWVVGAQAGMMPLLNQIQNDQGQELGTGSEMLKIVETFSRNLQETTGQLNSWLSRYQQVADVMKTNSDCSTELLGISHVAMPFIWNTFQGNVMMNALEQIAKGRIGSPFIPSPVPQQSEFLFVYPSELTCDSKFTVQAVVMPKSEANVAFSLHFAPPEGEAVDFAYGDVFFTFHLRWHYQHGPSKEIALNDRYDGTWSRGAIRVGGNLWPNVEPGKRFIVSVTKNGPCFVTFVILGDDMHLAVPFHMNPLVFCPKEQKTGDPRKLWLTVHEDNRGANEVIVQWVTWMPADDGNASV